MLEVPQIIHEAGMLSLDKLVILSLVVLLGFIIFMVSKMFKLERNTNQINNAVNHRSNGSTTMSQDVLEIKDKLLDFKEKTHDNFDKVNSSLEGIHEKIKVNTKEIEVIKKKK